MVKGGDIVQFDWNDSGDEDHTGIVTRVEKNGHSVAIYYAGHTSNTDYQSVDESLRNGGGTVSFWNVK
ncbi:amidase domain-containing protein [Cryobacterium fucosi]|uniref:amidase domain-containing protein n=1 Tax=Cryobacterium fucosi TaxID=1259157 RepID=UPI00210393BA|nr:amidase domain-containing protein [Cryobacterium fucosi]